MSAAADWQSIEPERDRLDRLTWQQEIAVTWRIVNVTGLLAMARHGAAAGAGKVLRQACHEAGGGNCADEGVGDWWFDSKGARASQTQPGWSLSWSRMAEIVLAGLTPGIVVGAAHAYRRYCNLHRQPWESQQMYGEGAFSTNAVTDPLAYELIWWPEYMRMSRMMCEAEMAAAAHALDVLAAAEPALQLGLFA